MLEATTCNLNAIRELMIDQKRKRQPIAGGHKPL